MRFNPPIMRIGEGSRCDAAHTSTTFWAHTERSGCNGLIEDFEAELFDDGIGQHFFGDFLDFLFGVVAIRAVELQDKEFALAHVFYFRVSERRKRALNRLTLRVENRRLEHHPNVSRHRCTSLLRARSPPRRAGATCGELYQRR